MNKPLLKPNGLLLIFLLSVLSLALGVFIGSANIGFFDVFKVVGEKLMPSFSNSDITNVQKEIIWNIRLPRVLVAFFAGSALSLGGAIVQSVLKNPLASPYTMGVSSGASLAVSVLIVTGISVPFLGVLFKPLVGFLAGLLAVAVVITITVAIDKVTTGNAVVLTGMVLSLFYNAVQTLIFSFSPDDIKQIVVWQMGSFSLRGWAFFYALLPFFVFGFLAAFVFNKELDVMTLGDEQARSIGVNTAFVTPALLTIAAVLTGASVAVCGVIGFVDLVTPHIARRLFGSKHVLLLPATALIGGVVMVVSDLLARSLFAPMELPIGAVTAFIGAPFFVYLFFKK